MELKFDTLFIVLVLLLLPFLSDCAFNFDIDFNNCYVSALVHHVNLILTTLAFPSLFDNKKAVCKLEIFYWVDTVYDSFLK